MGRFRIFSKHKTIDSSEYNRELNAKSFYSYSRLKSPCKDDNNFKINYDTYDVDTFKDYDTFLKFSRGMSLLNPSLNCNCDIPINLDQGIEAILYYPVSTTGTYNCMCCDVNKCKEITGKLYPHGYVNNKVLRKLVKFPNRINVYCCKDNVDNPKYKIYKCHNNSIYCGCKHY